TRFSRDWSSDVCSSDLFSEKSQLAVASALLRATCNSLQRIRSWSGRQPFESITRPSTPVPDSCPETFRHHDEPLSEVGAMKYIRSEERRVGKGLMTRQV